MRPEEKVNALQTQVIEVGLVAQALWGADDRNDASSWDELSEYGRAHYLNMAAVAIIKLNTLRAGTNP